MKCKIIPRNYRNLNFEVATNQRNGAVNLSEYVYHAFISDEYILSQMNHSPVFDTTALSRNFIVVDNKACEMA